MDLNGKRILITGSSGFIGRNLVAFLADLGIRPITPAHAEFNLLEQSDIRRLMTTYQPEIVFHLAGLVGGILANKQRPADFCYENLFIGSNVLHEAQRSGVKKFITLIGGCSYPATAKNPIRESELWMGYPQPESAPYSLAKAMSVVLTQSYRQQYDFDGIVLVPGNVYGPHDNFNLNSSHVIPALIRKFHTAALEGKTEVAVWGAGKAIRDFIFVEDVCRAIWRAAETYSGGDIINISSGIPCSIRELAELVAEITGYTGRIFWDRSKPEGQMEKIFENTRMRDVLDIECITPLREGLEKTIAWFRANDATARL